MNKYYGIIISLIAGLSTILGYFCIYIKGNKENIISKSLSFAGGVMITLSVIDLFPTGVANLKSNYDNFYAFLLSIVSFFMGFFICHIIENKFSYEDKLYKTGLVSMLGIMLHNIPEGVVTYVLSTVDLKLGIIFSIAIILHNIPEGISISVPIYYSTESKKKSFIYTFVSGMSEPLGAILSMLFLYKYISNILVGIMFSFISGLMIYIGYYELIKGASSYKNRNLKIYVLIGVLFIIIVEILLKI